MWKKYIHTRIENKQNISCLVCGKIKPNNSRSYYCSKKCKHKSVLTAQLIRNIRKRFFMPIFQVRQLGLVSLYWRRAKKPMVVLHI